MQTDKPLISILMAVYEPRMDWLREQLESLEAQTYSNLRIYICDDCSPSVPFERIKGCVKQCIRSIPCEIFRNERNLGSTKTFERLTQGAEGEYLAYCDQDDRWLPEKLEVLYREIEKSGALLVCSDMYIINENGERYANSITEVRRHHKFRSGNALSPKLLISNFVTGCTVLVKSAAAKEAVPFCPYMVHDHYLALFAAARGSVVSLPQPLIEYRIHDGNQTLMMSGVVDKESYFRVRIQLLRKRLCWLQKAFQGDLELSAEIASALLWADARERNFKGNFAAKWTVWKYRRFGPLTSLFEVLFSGSPEFLFCFFIEMKRKNRV